MGSGARGRPGARPGAARRLVAGRRRRRLHARRRSRLAGPALRAVVRRRALDGGRHARRRAGVRVARRARRRCSTPCAAAAAAASASSPRWRSQLFPVTTVYGGDLTYRADDAAEVLDAVVALGRRRTRRADVERRAAERAGRAFVDHRARLLERPGRTRAAPCSTAGGGRCHRSSTAGASSASRTSPRSPPIRSSRRPASSRAAGWRPRPATPSRPPSAPRWPRPRSPADGPPVLRYCEVRHAGGAVATSPQRSSSSMGNRDHAFLLHLVGVADGRHDVAAIARHQDATRAALGAELSARELPQRARRCGPGRRGGVVHRRRRPGGHRRRGGRRSTPTDVLRFGVRPHL